MCTWQPAHHCHEVDPSAEGQPGNFFFSFSPVLQAPPTVVETWHSWLPSCFPPTPCSTWCSSVGVHGHLLLPAIPHLHQLLSGFSSKEPKPVLSVTWVSVFLLELLLSPPALAPGKAFFAQNMKLTMAFSNWYCLPFGLRVKFKFFHLCYKVLNDLCSIRVGPGATRPSPITETLSMTVLCPPAPCSALCPSLPSGLCFLLTLYFSSPLPPWVL